MSKFFKLFTMPMYKWSFLEALLVIISVVIVVGLTVLLGWIIHKLPEWIDDLKYKIHQKKKQKQLKKMENKFFELAKKYNISHLEERTWAGRLNVYTIDFEKKTILYTHQTVFETLNEYYINFQDRYKELNELLNEEVLKKEKSDGEKKKD